MTLDFKVLHQGHVIYLNICKFEDLNYIENNINISHHCFITSNNYKTVHFDNRRGHLTSWHVTSRWCHIRQNVSSLVTDTKIMIMHACMAVGEIWYCVLCELSIGLSFIVQFVSDFRDWNHQKSYRGKMPGVVTPHPWVFEGKYIIPLILVWYLIQVQHYLQKGEARESTAIPYAARAEVRSGTEYVYFLEYLSFCALRSAHTSYDCSACHLVNTSYGSRYTPWCYFESCSSSQAYHGCLLIP